MSDYHEHPESLGEATMNITRALHSFKEEIEHACMVIEWLRRNMAGRDESLKTFLFSRGDIAALEEE
jgi:hypothetical protein